MIMGRNNDELDRRWCRAERGWVVRSAKWCPLLRLTEGNLLDHQRGQVGTQLGDYPSFVFPW